MDQKKRAAPPPAPDPRDELELDPILEKKRDESPPAPAVPAPEPPITREGVVDENSDESFPASDPPSFTPTTI
jgi:hypothetical protein